MPDSATTIESVTIPAKAGAVGWSVGIFTVAMLCFFGLFIAGTSFVLHDGLRYYALADDAMISMRYAWNWAHGGGLLWNADSFDRVEGYTNPLMTILMSILAWVAPDKRLAVLGVQLLGIVTLLGIAHAVTRVARQLTAAVPRRDATMIVVLSYFWTLTHYPLDAWTLSGGEVGLLAWTLALATSVFLAKPSTGFARDLQLGTLVGVAYLIRPDGLVVGAVLLAAWLVCAAPGERISRSVVLMPVLAIVAAHVGLRWWYYGDWLPNTYHLKIAKIPLHMRFRDGFVYTLPFLVKYAHLIALALVSLIAHPTRQKLFIVGTLAASIIYQIYVGGDAFPGWRFLLPAQVLTFPLAIDGLLILLTAAARMLSPLNRPGLLWTSLAVGSIVLLTPPNLVERQTQFTMAHHSTGVPEQLEDLYSQDGSTFVGHNKTNIRIALALNEVLAPDARIGVFWAGAIAYYSDFDAIDFLGKSDRYIARLAPDVSGAAPRWFGMWIIPGHNKYDLHYSIRQLEPDYIQHDRYGVHDLRESLNGHYRWVQHRGVHLCLKVGSPHVRWDRINPETEHARRL